MKLRVADILAGIGVATIILPLMVVAVASLDPRGLTGNLLLPGITLKWYQSFFAFQPFITGVYLSVTLGALATVLSIGFALPASIVIARRKFRGREFLNTIFLSPLVIPGVVSGSAFLFFFYSIGLRNSFSNLVLAHTILTIPFAIRVLTSSLIGLDRSIEEAAMNLGADELRTFLRITLPQMKTGLVATTVFTLAASFQDVDTSIFLAIGTTKTFPIVLLSYLRQGFDPTVAAGSTLIVGWTFLLILILDRTLGLKTILS